jgi:hypothetical protein
MVVSSPEPVDRAGLGRVAPVDDGLRAVHQAVLRAFAETGKPPSKFELDAVAAPFGTDGEEVLRQLHDRDFLRLESGVISAAYPFSGVPTPHVVQIRGGSRVFSMCAIDALGMAAMLDEEVTIQSAEPESGCVIEVRVSPSGEAIWEPAAAVVFLGERRNCETTAAADLCCGFINFFTSKASADAWAERHPEVSGRVLGQEEAMGIGVRTFGSLLRS